MREAADQALVPPAGLMLLPVQMLLASAMTTFLGKTSEDLRQTMLTRWQRVCELDSFNYMRLLSTESELLQWKSMGLPADNLSIENALVISNAKMAAQLKDIESTILKLLSESSGNILDDEGLINTLAQSKVTSNEIEVKAAEAAKTEVMIDTTREEIGRAHV